MKSSRSEPLPSLPRDETTDDVSVAERSVQRTLESRTVYSEEVARLIGAAIAVMRRSQSKNPTVSVSDTIAEAGLSNQAFYRHFQGKDEFLLAILDDGLRQLLVYLEREMAQATSPLDKVRKWVQGRTCAVHSARGGRTHTGRPRE